MRVSICSNSRVSKSHGSEFDYETFVAAQHDGIGDMFAISVAKYRNQNGADTYRPSGKVMALSIWVRFKAISTRSSSNSRNR